MCLCEIAVLIGSEGKTVPVSEPGTFVVYRRDPGHWQSNRTFSFSLDKNRGLSGLRHTMTGLTAFLGTCEAVVAQSVGGAVLFELEKTCRGVYEISGRPEEFLESVWKDLKEEHMAGGPVPPDGSVPAPCLVAPGRFSISIREIQGRRPDLSSKQVLREFVLAGAFDELEITCDHLPPWVEADAERCGYDLATEWTGPHDLKVHLKNTRGAC
jgi:Fe-only nitrogenase accessory protein AnfO